MVEVCVTVNDRRLRNAVLPGSIACAICPLMKAIVNLSREETLKVRYNQPRVSLEQLRQQVERHRRASEEFSEASRTGP